MGRPRKYIFLIKAVNENCLYTASLIVDEGIRKGVFKNKVTVKKRTRIRATLNRFARENIATEDGYITQNGIIYRAWFGKTWKKQYCRHY